MTPSRLTDRGEVSVGRYLLSPAVCFSATSAYLSTGKLRRPRSEWGRQLIEWNIHLCNDYEEDRKFVPPENDLENSWRS